MKNEGFLSYERTRAFSRRSGEQYDRPSPRAPSLIECIDVEQDDDNRRKYKVVAFLSIASAYEQPVFMLRETARCLGNEGMGFRSSGRRFDLDENVEELQTALLEIVFPWLYENADLAWLRDLYLFLGRYKRKGLDPSIFRKLEYSASVHSRHPSILMTLEGIIGDLAKAKHFLRLSAGDPDKPVKYFEVDMDAARALHEQGSTWGEIVTNGPKREVEPWFKQAYADIEGGVFRTGRAVDVLTKYRRVGSVHYEKIST